VRGSRRRRSATPRGTATGSRRSTGTETVPPQALLADWDAIPDLHDMVDAVRMEFERHADAARVTGTAQAVGAG
jgi:hypothetical protein